MLTDKDRALSEPLLGRLYEELIFSDLTISCSNALMSSLREARAKRPRSLLIRRCPNRRKVEVSGPACSLRCDYSTVPLAPRSTDPETTLPVIPEPQGTPEYEYCRRANIQQGVCGLRVSRKNMINMTKAAMMAHMPTYAKWLPYQRFSVPPFA